MIVWQLGQDRADPLPFDATDRLSRGYLGRAPCRPLFCLLTPDRCSAKPYIVDRPRTGRPAGGHTPAPQLTAGHIYQEPSMSADENKITERRSNSVQATLELFDPTLQRLEQFAHQIQEMGDRINGGRPRPTVEAAGPTPSTSLLQNTRHRLDRLKSVTDMIERELRALSEGLWAD